ncbi:MAG: hypothetical protein ACI8RD_006227, partial [Bacillariaceae sp.]|jgi:hypothetical protein
VSQLLQPRQQKSPQEADISKDDDNEDGDDDEQQSAGVEVETVEGNDKDENDSRVNISEDDISNLLQEQDDERNCADLPSFLNVGMYGMT